MSGQRLLLVTSWSPGLFSALSTLTLTLTLTLASSPQVPPSQLNARVDDSYKGNWALPYLWLAPHEKQYR